MKQMQVRHDMEEIKLIIKALESCPMTAVNARENVAVAEMAARLRWRAVKLWGDDWTDRAPAQATPYATEYRAGGKTILRG
jgi:hypothetical protein